MDDPHELPPQSSETANSLPDVVHSQQIPAAGEAAAAAAAEVVDPDGDRNSGDENPTQNATETSETESISEHIPSKMDYSTESDQMIKNECQGPLTDTEKVLKLSLIPPHSLSLGSDHPEHDPCRSGASWPLASPAEVHPISEESPVNLASEISKDGTQSKSATRNDDSANSASPEPTHDTLKDQASPRTEFVDSLNEEASNVSNSNSISIGPDSSDKSSQSEDVNKEKREQSSGSDEVIKLDIRGQGAPKFPLPSAKIIFGPPPDGSTLLDPNVEPIPVFQNLLSPFLVGAGDGIKVEEVFDFDAGKECFDAEDRDPSLFQSKEATPDQTTEFPYQVIEFPDDIDIADQSKDPTPDSDKSLLSDKELDVLIEEVTVDHDMKQKEAVDDTSIPTQPKSMAPEDTISFSTMTTDYKTICEEYQVKLVHLEEALAQRDDLIEELTISLQRSVRERDELQSENVHLSHEMHTLQHIVAEHSRSDHDTVKGQLSDFVQYQNLVKDDNAKCTGVTSDGSSVQSSNGEKDMDREEITVSYSRSDVKSSDESSDEFQTGFELKLTTIIDKFDGYLEENLRNNLRESIIQVLCTEIGKMRLESDTEVKELESQMQQEKQVSAVEARRLRELLASVRAGNADIDSLRRELAAKHEKEMENLRTYFEKKCTDMERSYSEEVWRGRTCVSPSGSWGSAGGVGAVGGTGGAADGCGDCPPRRRARSADIPALTSELGAMDQLKTSRKNEQTLEEARAEHAAHVAELSARHRDTVASLEEQIVQLKAHIQTADNTETNVSVYQQDIDLELEKDETQDARLEEIRQEVVHQLQEQIKVLLSDPDADLASWPLELVALRDKIQGDARAQHDKELSSLRDELCGGGGETDKWKQRRNYSFDQNRQLEEVTKERDGLRRVAGALQRAVGQLVAYCACAEDELNRTVLTRLLARLSHDTTTLDLEDSRPSTPNLSIEINTSSVSRTSKHVHFAPDLQSILAELDEDGLVGFLQEQRDLSADIKNELEHSLRRLRHEAHELLDLSSKLSIKQPAANMLEPPALRITELVEEMDARPKRCDNCELHRKTMEEAMSECLQREALLRADLEAAQVRIAGLMTDQGRDSDLVAEGYGTVGPLRPLSLPGLPGRASPLRRAPGPGPESGALSLDGCASPRAHIARMAQDLDTVLRERDDLQQQLEAANRQLRSTRQFVEEQATERECERDEFARRLADLRDENQRLAARLQTNARILNEVEQLEAQTREMTQIIAELEARKAVADEELKSNDEKVSLLRDIIANLESQLEQKTSHETEILRQLEVMRRTIDERDEKMRSVIGELEALRREREEDSQVMCVRCGLEEDRYTELLDKVKEQCRQLEESIHRRARRLERVHEVCSAPCSEPSEDVSKRDQRNTHAEAPPSPGSTPSPRVEPILELAGVWERLHALARAEDAALKRIQDLEMQRKQLNDVAQEVRAERDVLQARMSEQALRISSLAARLQRQRNDADALAHQAHSQLSVQLHDALAEVQRLREELESKDKQLVRVKQNLEEREKLSERHNNLYGDSCNPKDKVIILERELGSAQNRVAQLEVLARSLENDKETLQSALSDQQRALADKEEQLQELLGLKLEEEPQKDEKSDLDGVKTSARTLSDIVSISEFDEQDLQMRRAELCAQNINLTGAPYDTNKAADATLPPDVQRPNMSSLNLDFGDNFDISRNSPRADSLPAHLTSTQNKDAVKQYKRNVNETTVFGTAQSAKHSTPQNIPDNCSLYPNRDVSDSKNVSVEPKKINFSLEASKDNKTQDEEYISLKELGITMDLRQENFPDILTQLKHEIKRSRNELEACKSELKNAEEQLCEFPALKEEVEELKGLLENTMATMENDKKFYENQLDNFSSNKRLLEQRLTELTQEVNDKSKDLHLLKEDILRRENMILELAKEKRNLTNKMAELEVKIDELQSKNNQLEKYESECHQLREKLSELQRLEQLLSDKNHQIDSLNQHLDRLDDMQRRLNDKTEEMESLKEAFEEKSNELFRMQDIVESMNQNVAQLNEQNKTLNESNKELKIKLSKLEKEQENASLKLQNSESELERVNSLNNELSTKIAELKQLAERLKDKETEIEIMNEDINAFHEEIATLKEQLKMVSRSPSPPGASAGSTPPPRRATRAARDPRQLTRIRKQVALLQYELDFNKKELNDKAFELSKAKLDVTELTNSVGQASKLAQERLAACQEMASANDALRHEAHALREEKQLMAAQLESLVARIREEGNVSELQGKLRAQAERCRQLEAEVHDLKELAERLREVAAAPSEDQRALVVSGTRSPTAELERALRDQLHYSHALDEDIMEQILSGSSDEREDIPRLALNSSKSSSVHSSTSERVNRLRVDNERLQSQLAALHDRLADKDALIAELNRIRDKLSAECQSAVLKYEAERDNAGRLQLLLDTHKETADSLQHQDSSMIGTLKKRLEAAMANELELQQREQAARARSQQLERQLLAGGKDQLAQELENVERLAGEISLLRSRLEGERARYGDLQALFDQHRMQAQREIDAKADACAQLRAELADAKRQKHDQSVELVRARELSRAQAAAIAQLEAKMAAAAAAHSPLSSAITEFESHKSELARELATLKRCLSGGQRQPSTQAETAEVAALRADRARLQARVEQLERTHGTPDEKDQAIRYVQSRCLRLESCRKALVWQKRYLQRVLKGYEELERGLRMASASRSITHHQPNGDRPKKRFKCVATAVVAVVRMGYLVRRRMHARVMAAHCLLRSPQSQGHGKDGQARGHGHSPLVGVGASTSPPTRDRPPAAPAAPAAPADALAPRALRHDPRLNLPLNSPTGDYNIRRSPFAAGANSPREQPFMLSSPRGEVAAAYLNKLELISRCLGQAMDTSRDVP